MAKKDDTPKKKKADKSPESEPQVQHVSVVDKPIVEEMKESFIDYAMSVIMDRALPDVRDGLKPVHRRILFAMNGMGLTSSAKFRKSATVVGDVLGSYHPHGDSSVYEAMVKLAQDFTSRYPLVWGQGNFGSIDGDNAAAYRYTEAKMAKISSEVLRDIEKDTVDYRPNFDGTKKEPIVLPTVVPGLLLNGTLGIAVGMATNIPPHNLRELSKAIVHLLENPEATTEDLMEFVQGPDFPMGGIVFNKKDIHHAYATGRGGMVARGVAEVVENKPGSFQIVITSIPFRVNKADLIVKIANLVRDKKVEGIKDIRDESTKDIRVAIDLKGSSHPQKVLNTLYKHTQLEDTFHMNLVALVDGVPQTLTLKGVLELFIKHRLEVVERRTKFDLRKAEAREHILLGLSKALDHIDEIIKLIKKSKDTPEAHANLMKKFKFSEIQATAILEMRLQKLAGLERKKIEDELKAVQELIKQLKKILSSKKERVKIVKTETIDVADKYGDDRRTHVVKSGVKTLAVEDLIADEDQTLVLTSGGYIKRTSPDEFKKQKRGGVGVVDLNTKEEDFVTAFLTASTHSDVLFFTDKGKVYQVKMYDLPEGKRATRGKSIMNFLSIEQDEKVTSVRAMPKEVKDMDLSVLMVTKNGVVKRVDAASFHDVRRNGIIAIKLADGDLLKSVSFIGKDDSAIIVTENGQSIRFEAEDAREMGRAAAGVRGIKLGKGDSVVAARTICKEWENPELLVLMANGYGKKTTLDEYKIQNRGGSGIKTAKVTVKTGKVIGAHVVTDEQSEIIAMSKNSQVIRTDIEGVPSLGRQTQGVKIMKMRAGDSIASLICL